MATIYSPMPTDSLVN